MVVRFSVIEYDYSIDFCCLENPKITKLFIDEDKANEYIRQKLIEKWRTIIADKKYWQADSGLLPILINFLDDNFEEVEVTDEQIIDCINKITFNPYSLKHQLIQLRKVHEI